MQIEGKNSVVEAINAGKTFNRLYIQKDILDNDLKSIMDLAREKGIRFELLERKAMQTNAQTKNYQGVIGVITEFEYSHLDEIISKINSQKRDGFIVILDGIEDPHNLGAILRTCECAGVDGVIIPQHRACAINETVVKTSAGASNYVGVAKVVNINDAIKALKDDGYWVYAVDMDGKPTKYFNLNGKIALVIGNEGKGLHALTKRNCDDVIGIRMHGKINSLNASVACGIVIFECVNARVS